MRDRHRIAGELGEDVFEGPSEIGGRLEAVFGALGHERADDRFHFVRDDIEGFVDASTGFRGILHQSSLAYEGERLGVIRLMLQELIGDAAAGKRDASRDEVIKSTAKAVEIGTDVAGVRIDGLFGGDEVGRAHHGPEDGEVGFTGIGEAGQAEVEDFDIAPATFDRRARAARTGFLGDEEIGRLDVAVHQAAFVGVLQPEGGLADEIEGGLDGQRALPLDQAGEVDAVDVFHGDRMQAVGFVGVVRTDDVRMAQLADGTHLALEPLHGLDVFQAFAAKHFEGDEPVERPLPGLENLAHAPFADLVQAQKMAYDQILGMAQEDLVGLISRQPFAADEFLSQAPGRREFGGEARQLLPLGRLQDGQPS